MHSFHQSVLNSGLGDRVEYHEMLDILYKVSARYQKFCISFRTTEFVCHRSEHSWSTSCTSQRSPRCVGESSSGSSQPWWPSSTPPPTPSRQSATSQVLIIRGSDHFQNWISPPGLYLWNGIALCSSTASVVTWMVQFYLRLTHNLLIREYRSASADYFKTLL